MWVNVTSYINKGKDAAIKGNLSTLLTNSAAYFDTNSNLTNFKTDTVTGCNGPINAAITGAGGTLVCYTNGTNFAACSVEKLNSSQYFCVDSSGVKKEGGATCSTPVCP